jgi:hypothetical protein
VIVSIWPIEPLPLAEGEVEVTIEQLSDLALIAENIQNGLVSNEQAAVEMLRICPELQLRRINKLVVRYPPPHSF